MVVLRLMLTSRGFAKTDLSTSFWYVEVHSSLVARAQQASKMDVSMPFMGGMEATELIRSWEMQEGLPPIPIIALTAHASMYYLEVCVVFPNI